MPYRVNLGTFKIGGENAPEQSVVENLVKLVSNTPMDPNEPQKGYTFTEIRERGKICDALEAAGPGAEFVDLADEVHAKLKDIVEKAPYLTADRGVLKMINAVVDAEKVK